MLQQDDLLTQKMELLLDMSSKKVLAELVKLQKQVEELKADIAELKRRKPEHAAQEPSQSQQFTQPMGAPAGAYNPYPPPGYPQQYPQSSQQFAQNQQQFAQQQYGQPQPAYGGAPEPPPGWQPRGSAPPNQPRGIAEESEPERRAKLDRPIDRNGVAPADVDIEKMFYFGNKKK